MNSQGTNHPKQKKNTAPDIQLEIALVKIARTLYEYIESQGNLSRSEQISPLLYAFQQVGDNYCVTTTTDRLNGGDLIFELAEWVSFKNDLLTMSPQKQTSSTAINKKFVDEYGKKNVLSVIQKLERTLGITG